MRFSVGAGVGPLRVTQPIDTKGTRKTWNRTGGWLERHPRTTWVFAGLNLCIFLPPVALTVWCVFAVVVPILWVVGKIRKGREPRRYHEVIMNMPIARVDALTRDGHPMQYQFNRDKCRWVVAIDATQCH